MKTGALAFSFVALIVALSPFVLLPQVSSSSDEPGTVGIGLAQLYSEQQPNHRGPLVVVRVVEGLPGATAHVQRGDMVVAINGQPVSGREFADINAKEIQGSVGSTIHLIFARLDGSQSEIGLTRVPYPPHTSAVADPFAYAVPGNWGRDPRWNFPLPWAPTLPYHGVEDLFYAPNFGNPNSPEYHSYLFFWWIENTRVFTVQQIQQDMLAYYHGLAEERGKNYGFTPDLAKVAADYRLAPQIPQALGRPAAQSFLGTVTVYDTHGNIITLNSEVVAYICPGTGHTAAFVGSSLEPRTRPIWKKMESVRDTLRCRERK